MASEKRMTSKRMSKSAMKQQIQMLDKRSSDLQGDVENGGMYSMYPSNRGHEQLGNAQWMENMEKVQGVKWQLTPNFAIHRLRKMLAEGFTYGLPGTRGSVYMCLYNNLKQEHSVLSVCYGHPLHPFSRSERLLFLLICTCWIFFVSVETSFLGDVEGVLATLILVVPFKKFVRLILECPCLYYKGYSFEHEVKNDEVQGEEQQLGVRCAAAAAGHAVSAFMFCGCIVLVAVGALRAQFLDFSNFITKWFFSQVASVSVTEPLMMLAQALFHIYFWPGEKSKFDGKWELYFHHISAPTPRCMSDVGLRAKFIFVKINGVTEFYRKFPDYDEWFHLGPSESYIRSMDRDEGDEHYENVMPGNVPNPLIAQQRMSPAKRSSTANPYVGSSTARASSVSFKFPPSSQNVDFREEERVPRNQALQQIDEGEGYARGSARKSLGGALNGKASPPRPPPPGTAVALYKADGNRQGRLDDDDDDDDDDDNDNAVHDVGARLSMSAKRKSALPRKSLGPRSARPKSVANLLS